MRKKKPPPKLHGHLRCATQRTLTEVTAAASYQGDGPFPPLFFKYQFRTRLWTETRATGSLGKGGGLELAQKGWMPTTWLTDGRRGLKANRAPLNQEKGKARQAEGWSMQFIRRTRNLEKADTR